MIMSKMDGDCPSHVQTHPVRVHRSHSVAAHRNYRSVALTSGVVDLDNVVLLASYFRPFQPPRMWSRADASVTSCIADSIQRHVIHARHGSSWCVSVCVVQKVSSQLTASHYSPAERRQGSKVTERRCRRAKHCREHGAPLRLDIQTQTHYAC